MNRLQQQCAPPCAAQRGSTRHYLWVMSYWLGVAMRSACLKYAGRGRSVLRPDSRRSARSRRFHCVSFTNPFTNLATSPTGKSGYGTPTYRES